MEYVNWFLKVIKNFKQYEGRARRAEFWGFTLIAALINIVVGGVLGAIGLSAVASLVLLALLVPAVCVGIRRLHDINKPGWWIIVPFYNLYLCAQEGHKGDNEYGSDPKAEAAPAAA
uniref:DUF805 domain-containing protein n=1 Tax=Thaumasiovibrio occultus TaxID=1891184 RepID=UPI000B35467E|nr:DUF805 domain-containing protein [Thaumasiovibrio occultus]